MFSGPGRGTSSNTGLGDRFLVAAGRATGHGHEPEPRLDARDRTDTNDNVG